MSQVLFPTVDDYVKKGSMELSIIRFEKLTHAPLRAEEAKCCLPTLSPKIFTALDQIHSDLHIAHLDVKLDNIYYNAKLELVLIDLDRW